MKSCRIKEATTGDIIRVLENMAKNPSMLPHPIDPDETVRQDVVRLVFFYEDNERSIATIGEFELKNILLKSGKVAKWVRDWIEENNTRDISIEALYSREY